MGQLDDLLREGHFRDLGHALYSAKATCERADYTDTAAVVDYLAAAFTDPQMVEALADWERRTERSDAEVLAEAYMTVPMPPGTPRTAPAVSILQRLIDAGRIQAEPVPDVAEGALVARLASALADLSEALGDAQQDNEVHMHEYRLMCDRLRTYGRHWASCDVLRDSDLGCDCGWTALVDRLGIVDVTEALRLAALTPPSADPNGTGGDE